MLKKVIKKLNDYRLNVYLNRTRLFYLLFYLYKN